MTKFFALWRSQLIIVAFIMGISPIANAGLIFNFQNDGNHLTMTTSGFIDTRKLVAVQFMSNWSNDGFGTFGDYSFIGDGAHGLMDSFFAFSPGTNFSEWHKSLNIFPNLQFDPDVNTGTQSFSTLTFPQPYTPGFNARSTDIQNGIWIPDATWTFFNASIESFGLAKGTYTVTDARSGEFIRYQIGTVTVPEPDSLLLFLIAGIGFVYVQLLNTNAKNNV